MVAFFFSRGVRHCRSLSLRVSVKTHEPQAAWASIEGLPKHALRKTSEEQKNLWPDVADVYSLIADEL